MVTMQSGFTDTFSSEKSSRSIQCRDVFLSVACMDYAGKERPSNPVDTWLV